MLLNKPHCNLGQSCANSWQKNDQPANNWQACLVLLCTTLTPLKNAARKLPFQSIPPALRVKFNFFLRWTFNDLYYHIIVQNVWMLHYYYSSANIEIKRHINRHFTLVCLLGITRLCTVNTGTGEEPSINTSPTFNQFEPFRTSQHLFAACRRFFGNLRVGNLIFDIFQIFGFDAFVCIVTGGVWSDVGRRRNDVVVAIRVNVDIRQMLIRFSFFGNSCRCKISVEKKIVIIFFSWIRSRSEYRMSWGHPKSGFF